MANYNFNDLLSPLDFEILSRDLLQKHLDVYLESYAKGRDGGVDFKLTSLTTDKKTIVQVKNYKDYSNLKSNLKKEVDKVKELNPENYILTTAVSLTPGNKKEIIQIFDSFIKSTEDIYGRDDLNNLLSTFKDIERKHFKLWFTSTNVFMKLLNNSIFVQTNLELDEIKQNCKKWILPNCFDEALHNLRTKRIIMISGEPGIGKTTLARIMSLEIIEEEFEFIYCYSFEDLFSIYDPEKKQIFYFDDFLGHSFFDKNIKESQRKKMYNIVKAIHTSNNKYLILTTREYVWNQASNYFSKEYSNELNVTKFIHNLDRFNEYEKAKILYNHLYFSGLDKEYLRKIVENLNYSMIINHENYNPRLIENITNSKEVLNTVQSSDDYFTYCIKLLDDPYPIWDEAFTKNISELSNIVLSIMLTLGSVDYYNLLDAVKKHIEGIGENFNELEFSKSLKELETTFLKYKVYYSNNTNIDYANPSIQDYLVNYFQKNIDQLENILNNAAYFDQFIRIFNFKENVEKHKIQVDDNFYRYLIDCIIKQINILPLKTIGSKRGFLDRVKLVIESIELKNDQILYAEIRYKTSMYFLNHVYEKNDLYTAIYVIEFFDIFDEIKSEALFKYLTDLVRTIDDLQELKSFVFDEEFKEYIVGNTEFRQDITDILEQVVTDEEEFEIETLMENIEDIQDYYNLDEDEAAIIQEKAKAIEFNEPEYNDEEYKKYKRSKYEREAENERNIENLFKSLIN